MRMRRERGGLTADGACRIALGAFYNATARHPRDGAALVGAWMEEISRKLKRDAAVGLDYREIIARWEAEENAPDNARFATGDNPPENAAIQGAGA